MGASAYFHRRYYDKVVVATLLILKKHLGDDIVIGSECDWWMDWCVAGSPEDNSGIILAERAAAIPGRAYIGVIEDLARS